MHDDNDRERLVARVAQLEAELGVCKDMLTQSFAMAFAMGAPPHCTLEEAMVHIVAGPRKEVERLTAERDALNAALGDSWMPVGVRLPPLGKLVDLWADEHRCADWVLLETRGQLAFWHNGACRYIDEVTHWRALPAPPKE